MPEILAFILKNRWAQYAVMVLALLAAWYFVRRHYIEEGKKQGQQEQAQQNNADVQDQHKAGQEATSKQLEVIQQQITVILSQQAQQQQLIMTLATQRQQATQQVASATPAQVESIINAALGRQQGAQDTPEDRRKFADCLTQLPLCEKQVLADTELISSTQKLAETRKNQYETLSNYTVSLEGWYAQIWNNAAEPKRSPKCLYLWKCSRAHLKAPDPGTFKIPDTIATSAQ